ncbi:GLPGLI family protein [Flavobacteriaceae bacterium S356]|uniref:GLPGLI family protein n=1 Tax=Asprobacillus argus TaxID=3076534 RepID=A0ABU3LGK2_9FLAO|nr:GLPGLI family protein [Flavobacteriaceae bacterium S356]
MKILALKFALIILIVGTSTNSYSQGFQGKAIYLTKSKMRLGNWGARLSAGQKKQIEARLKNRLEKKYVLTFNNQESMFLEEEKIDAISGATDSWGGYFSRGNQYKNTKKNTLVQSQEFYGKRFLVKDQLYRIDWQMSSETKQIGQYTCYKATATVPTSEIAWYNFSWGDLRPAKKDSGSEEVKVKTTTIEAWYSLQIPVSHGPGEFYGLPGLILEVSAGDTVMLCSELIMNPKEKIKIKAPNKGQEITKKEYAATIRKKMSEMRDMRMGRRRSR